MSQQINQTNDISSVPELSQPTIAYSTFQSINTYSTLEEEVVSLREEKNMEDKNNKNFEIIVNTEDEDNKGPNKILGTTEAVAYNINQIIGSGIFLIPGNVWRLTKSPGITVVFFIIGGFFSILGSVVYAKLSEMLPKGAGELRYLDEAFQKPRKIIALAFSHAIILPTWIVADAYVASQYVLYTIRGESGEYLDPTGYFSNDFLGLAARINQIIAAFKILALSAIIIVGLIQLQNVNYKNHWANIFKNTINDQRTPLEQVGSYGDAMLQVLFAYEDLTDELIEPDIAKSSNIYSIFITIPLYILANVAYITVVNPEDAVIKDEIIAINFGKALLGETGKKLISVFIAISSFGAVAAMIYSGSRIIAYAARNGLITFPNSLKLSGFHQKLNTPINALVFQLVYCTILTTFFPTYWNIFLFMVTTSLYLTILYHGISAISLMILQKRFPTIISFSKAVMLSCSFLLLIILIAIVTFFPLPISEDISLYYIPYVISWSAVLLGGLIPYLYGRFGNVKDDK
ncbi:20052_t:CDS:10 [Dentiscutata erythropus]|uniref:20052_t:CDS:1 n=1 Tax=Dentiscutata erythropus TaxID=1348616 RepID=A0A9N9EEA8_9GLOM|nr:20052_t:CDS:10 [Dentiscutata erythropus]